MITYGDIVRELSEFAPRDTEIWRTLKKLLVEEYGVQTASGLSAAQREDFVPKFVALVAEYKRREYVVYIESLEAAAARLLN